MTPARAREILEELAGYSDGDTFDRYASDGGGSIVQGPTQRTAIKLEIVAFATLGLDLIDRQRDEMLRAFRVPSEAIEAKPSTVVEKRYVPDERRTKPAAAAVDGRERREVAWQLFLVGAAVGGDPGWQGGPRLEDIDVLCGHSTTEQIAIRRTWRNAFLRAYDALTKGAS